MRESRKTDVCLIGNCNPSSNPRLVREANLLAGHGIKTVVVTPNLVPRWAPYDESLSNGKWTHLTLDLIGEKHSTLLWQYVRTRRRLASALSHATLSNRIVSRAYSYVAPEIARLAASTRARLFIAHTHGALSAAASAARMTGGKYAFDAEDVLAESSTESQRLVRRLEQAYLPGCTYVSTMSTAAADYFRGKHHLTNPVIVTHNVPSLRERDGLLPPNDRLRNSPLKIYWFGQTLGSFSCAEDVIAALSVVRKPVHFSLRGAPVPEYINRLSRMATSLGVQHQIEYLPIVSPQRMVLDAAEYDVAWAAQPSQELFHQLAIGNKVFTGMMAGLALLLTDTVAHRQLLSDAPGCGELVPRRDTDALAKIIRALGNDPVLLAEMKVQSWRHAGARFNWERDSLLLLETVCQCIHGFDSKK